MKFYYTAKEVQEMLGFGDISAAYKRIQNMNKELESKGYHIIRGKIPIAFFDEKYPFVKEMVESEQKR